MEETIKRGRILRELLKQDRLSPVTIEYQMAMLISFNEGLFNELVPDQLAHVSKQLELINETGLTLDAERDMWVKEVTRLVRKAIESIPNETS